MTTTLNIGDEVTHLGARLVAVSPKFRNDRVCFVQAVREGAPGIAPELIVWTASFEPEGGWHFYDGRYFFPVLDGPEGDETRARAREAWLGRCEAALALEGL